ncbi:MAG: hypothetical protein KDA17_05685, partial [Candidatus Saccharibacteria bacterium]|nr:hypothetical protein [Candidatus Saccharibacteria bacterium]
MQVFQLVRTSKGWAKGAQLKVGPRLPLSKCIQAAHTQLAKLTRPYGVIAKNHRAAIYNRGELITIVDAPRKTRAMDKDKLPDPTPVMDAIEREAHQADEGRFRTSMHSGGVRMSNVHNMVPGYGTHIGRGRVLHNAKGTDQKQAGGSRRKAHPEETAKGSCHKAIVDLSVPIPSQGKAETESKVGWRDEYQDATKEKTAWKRKTTARIKR